MAEKLKIYAASFGNVALRFKVIPSSSIYDAYLRRKLISSREFCSIDPESLQNKLAIAKQKSSNMFEVLSAFFDSSSLAFKCLSVRLAAYEGAPIENLSSHYTETLYHMILGGIARRIKKT